MKKILSVTIALLAVAITANAQQSTSPAHGLYIGAGFINNWYSVSDTQNSIDNAWYCGPFVEIGYDLDMSKHSGMSFALRYDFLRSYKAACAIGPAGMPIYGETGTCRHYFDIPIRYKYNCRINYNSKFFFDLGPTLNFMLANTTYVTGATGWYIANGKIVWSEYMPELYNPFNLSIGATLGFHVGEAKLWVGYDYGGLISFTNSYYGRGQIHQLRIGAAYAF